MMEYDREFAAGFAGRLAYGAGRRQDSYLTLRASARSRRASVGDISSGR